MARRKRRPPRLTDNPRTRHQRAIVQSMRERGLANGPDKATLALFDALDARHDAEAKQTLAWLQKHQRADYDFWKKLRQKP